MRLKTVNISRLNRVLRFNHSWVQPQGFDTGIKIYNCQTKSKVPFVVKDKNLVKWYTCGPTVYDSAHIGHAACYTKLDVIQSVLKNYFGLNLVTVMNITDIDDKIIKKSNETKKTASEITQTYEKEFWGDMSALGIPKPDILLRVSENMDLILEFIDKLVQTEIAYKAKNGSVYLDVAKLSNYGKLQNIGEPDTKVEYKKNAADFALWKKHKDGEPFWDSPWGPGRPGWHIECSALATKVFGSNIDIHAGGIDLRFPHHENEEAQSCAYHSTNQWVNYWVHTGHLHLKGSEKMSKSLKNTVSVQEMLKNFKPEIFRMACVMSHYRSPMEFTDEFMATADALFNGYKKFVVNCGEYNRGLLKGTVNEDILVGILGDARQKIHHFLCDDFDTPRVIDVLNKVVGDVNAMIHSTPSGGVRNEVCVTALAKLVINTLDLFQVKLTKEFSGQTDGDFVDVMDILNSFRQDVRVYGISTKNQDILKLCDQVRDQLSECGVTVKDHGKVSSWSK